MNALGSDMRLSPSRLALGFALLLAAAPAARGQIQWNVTYSDTSGGFADTTVVNSTTLGQLRKDSVTASTNYLNTVLDGRGTVRLTFNTSFNSPGASLLASFGTSFALEDGSFSNGMVFQRAVSNTSAFGAPDGSGQVNFGKSWHYGVTGTNTTLNSGNIDFISVITHEIGHSLGFTALSGSDGFLGQGLSGNALNSADTYSTFDRHLQKGNVTGSGALFRTDIGQNTYGSFSPSASTATYTGGNFQNTSSTSFTNNTTEGLYFGGTYATEVFNGPVPIYSPTTFADGSSASHVNVGPGAAYGSGAIGLMNYQIVNNTVRRFQAYEIAMMLDLGWNVYNWNGTGGNWADGVSNLSQSRWRSEGITLGDSSTGFTRYNKFSTPNQAPILPVYGQTTSNIVLNFGGNSYTSTNDIGTVRLSRLNFTNTGAVTITGGTLNFGQNAAVDGVVTASVLVPKIVQNGAGAVTINSNIQVNNIATQTLLGSAFAGHSGLTIEGTGAGAVTLGGNITGTGGITKNSGTFGLTISGTGNTYSGGTTVNGGTLTVAAGSKLGTGSVTVNAGGTLARAGTGSMDVGSASTAATVTVANNGTLSVNLAASGTGSQLNLTPNAASVIDLKTGARLKLAGVSGFTSASAASYILALLSDGANIKKDGATVADGFSFGTFVQGTGNGGSNTVQFVDMNAFGVALNTGDTFTLRRSGNNLVLDFAPVPEPATVLAVGAAGLGAITWLRRRRKAAAETPTAA